MHHSEQVPGQLQKRTTEKVLQNRKSNNNNDNGDDDKTNDLNNKVSF